MLSSVDVGVKKKEWNTRFRRVKTRCFKAVFKGLKDIRTSDFKPQICSLKKEIKTQETWACFIQD